MDQKCEIDLAKNVKFQHKKNQVRKIEFLDKSKTFRIVCLAERLIKLNLSVNALAQILNQGVATYHVF